MLDLFAINSTAQSQNHSAAKELGFAKPFKQILTEETSVNQAHFASENETHAIDCDRFVSIQSERIAQEFEQKIIESEFEFGKLSSAELFAAEYSKNLQISFQIALGILYRKHSQNAEFLIGFYRSLANTESRNVYETGYAFVIPGLYSPDPNIVEAALTVIDHWNDPALAPIIAALPVKATWVKRYIARLLDNYKKALENVAG